MTVEPEEMTTLGQYVYDLSHEFDERTEERHRMGAEKYGPGKFMTVDTLEEALDEIVDLANYARYTFIKIRMLQDSIRATQQVPESLNTDFVTTRDMTKPQE